MREESERKAQEQEAKRKRLEEVEKKRQAMMKPSVSMTKAGQPSCMPCHSAWHSSLLHAIATMHVKLHCEIQTSSA